LRISLFAGGGLGGILVYEIGTTDFHPPPEPQNHLISSWKKNNKKLVRAAERLLNDNSTTAFFSNLVKFEKWKLTT